MTRVDRDIITRIVEEAHEALEGLRASSRWGWMILSEAGGRGIA